MDNSSTPTVGAPAVDTDNLYVRLQDRFSKNMAQGMRRSGARRKGDSEARNAINTFAATCGYQWSHVLTPVQRNTFLELGKNMTDENGRKKPLEGYTCFFTIATAVNGIGGTIPTQAPGSTPMPPAPLPDWQLVATRSLGGVVSVRVLSSQAYSSAKIQVLCAPFVLSGKDYFSASSFKQCVTLDGLLAGAGGTAIGGEIIAKYGVPAEGKKIAVKLRAISADGFRGPVYLRTTIVMPLTAEAAGDGDETATLKVG